VAVTFATVGPDALDGVRGGVGGDGAEAGEEPAERRGQERLSRIDLRGQNRPKYWRVSLGAFKEHPLRGAGAGAFAKLWARKRPVAEDVTEGHSLYLETLAELGLVGGILLVVVLVSALAPFLLGLRGGTRPLSAASFAAAVVWMLHSGLDWDWEMPVLSLWLFAAQDVRWRPRRAR
jgi:O-antigen ligase